MRPTKLTRWWTTVALAVLFLQAPANAKPGDGYQLLEPLPGEDVSLARGLSVTGPAVGLSNVSPVGGQSATAVLWDGPGEPARVLPPLPGDPGSNAWAINARGQVAGDSGAVVGFGNPGGATRAVVWEPDGTITVLPVPPDGVYTHAAGINAHGQVVGTSHGGSADHAVRWEPDGSITILQPPVANAGRLDARGINNRGEVVGTYRNGSGPAFWDAAGTGHALETLPDDPRGYAQDINARGEVCGDLFNGPGGRLGVVWNRGGIVRILDPLTGDVSSSTIGISDAGVVVGLSVSADGDRTPVKWEARSSEAVPLGLPAGLPQGLGVRINARGQILVWGTDDSMTSALTFLLE